MITREQVADLRNQDVVRLTNGQIPGLSIEGKLYEVQGVLGLCSWMPVRRTDGEPAQNWVGWTLTVVARAPRPLYVNHDRTEPVAGDVVTRGDSDAAAWSYCPHQLRQGLMRWRNTANDEWYAADDFLDFGAGLRLLVDGETGQVVPS